MSTEAIAAAMGAGPYALSMEQAAIRFGIESALEKAHWLAQMSVESQGFTRVRENLNYSPERLLAVFPGRNGLNTLTEAQALVASGRNAVAEKIYGGEWGRKNLGNTHVGDGAKFIGRSLIHLTGRGNVTAYSRATYQDDRIVDRPELLELAPDAALAAGWYWHWKGCKAAAMRDDILGVTRLVNGGQNGLEDRKRALAKAKKLFGVGP